MGVINETAQKQAEFDRLLRAVVHHVEAIRNQPWVSSNEKDQAVVEIQKVLPVIRRYLTYFRTKEMELQLQRSDATSTDIKPVL